MEEEGRLSGMQGSSTAAAFSLAERDRSESKEEKNKKVPSSVWLENEFADIAFYSRNYSNQLDRRTLFPSLMHRNLLFRR